MIALAEELAEKVGVAKACRVLGVPRSSLYRARQPKASPVSRPAPPRALSEAEKVEVRSQLNSERFCDLSPRQVYAILLGEGIHLCHWSTMYRILREYGEVQERRHQRRHPKSSRPVLKATEPNNLWSWDITQLRGLDRKFYYLYVILDVFSRYVPGWLLAERESAKLAEQLIAETCTKQGILPGKLTLHADRGSAMRSKTVAQLLKDLEVDKSHSRPYTPTDNPYSESQFKTMKYRPDYPQRFDGQEFARYWARDFFQWYNHEHYHSGLGLMTPAMVHYGLVDKVQEQRQRVLDAAYAVHPERFAAGRPTPPKVPDEVWINRPRDSHTIIELASPAASPMGPGAQAVSRVPGGHRRASEAALDAAEHLATMEQPMD